MGNKPSWYLARWGLGELQGLEGLDLRGAAGAAGRGAGHRGLAGGHGPGLLRGNIPGPPGKEEPSH